MSITLFDQSSITAENLGEVVHKFVLQEIKTMPFSTRQITKIICGKDVTINITKSIFYSKYDYSIMKKDIKECSESCYLPNSFSGVIWNTLSSIFSSFCFKSTILYFLIYFNKHINSPSSPSFLLLLSS